MKIETKQNILKIILIATILLIAFYPSFYGTWQYDDAHAIVNNTQIKSGIAIRNFISTPINYRIIPIYTFALNYHLGELNPFGYHIFNFIIHILSGISIYFLSKEILKFIYNDDNRDKNKIKNISFFTAFLWMLSPINVQAVTYIVQRMTSMAGLFYFSALFFYLKYKSILIFSKKKFLFLFLFLLLLLFSFFSKRNSYLIIFVLLYMEWSFFESFKIKKIRKHILVVIFITSSFLAVVTYFAINEPNMFPFEHFLDSQYPDREFTPLARLFIEPLILLYHVSQMLFPFVGRFHMAYDFDWLNAPYQILSYLSLFIVLLLVFLSIKLAKKHKLISFAIFFFFINHLIESSIIGLHLAFEHRNYVPSYGVFLLFALVIYKFNSKFNKYLITKVIIIVFILFSAVNTYFLNKKYEEKYCNAIFDYKTNCKSLNFDITSLAYDKFRDLNDFKNAYKIIDIEYNKVINSSIRKKLINNYNIMAIRLIALRIWLFYIKEGFDIEKSLQNIESEYISNEKWYNIDFRFIDNYKRIFYFMYFKSLLLKQGFIDSSTYQLYLLIDYEVFDAIKYFHQKNYDKFNEYILNDIKKMDKLELNSEERKILKQFKLFTLK